MNEKYERLIRDTFVFALGSFGSKIILFFMVPLYTNFLTREEYGIAEYVFTISQLLIPFVSVSIWEGVVRIGLKNGVKKENVLYNSMAVFLLSCIFVIAVTPLWNFYQPIAPWRVYLSVYTLSYILNQIFLNYIKIKDKNELFAFASVVQTLILAIFNFTLLVYFKFGISGYIISNIIAILSANVIVFFAGDIGHDIKCGCLDIVLLKSMLVYAAPLVVNNVSWWVIHSSDKIMIETFLTTGELGLYTVASKIPSLLNVFVAVFTQAWGLSSIREMESTNDKNYYSKVLETYSFVLFFFMLFFTLIVKPFMSVYVGEEFIEAWQYVPLLFYAAVLQAFSSYFGGLLGALQKSMFTMVTTLVGSLFNIILNYMLIQKINIWGVLIGTVSAFFIILFLRSLFIQQCIPLRLNWRRFTFNAILSLSCAVFVSTTAYGMYYVLLGMVCFSLVNRSMFLTIISLSKGLLKKSSRMISNFRKKE